MDCGLVSQQRRLWLALEHGLDTLVQIEQDSLG
jgi:hypothetical protein